jgi:hypothetical protein
MRSLEPVRQRTLELFAELGELEEPEKFVMPVLIDAILLAAAYRGPRHQITQLPELTESIDALMRELNIVKTTKQWERENSAAVA